MRIFITGASGYIGNAVAKAFRRKGHQVAGLVRSNADAQALLAEEISPVIGDMEHPLSYSGAIRHAEVLIHCAVDSASNTIGKDETVIEHFINCAEQGTFTKTFIYTSGIWVYGNTQTDFVDETATLNPLNISKWRPFHEERILNATSHLLRTAVIRPGVVYGRSGGLTNYWFSSIQDGQLDIAGSGQNFWSMVHVDDLAEAYVLAAEKEVEGIILNVTDDLPTKIQGIADALTQVLRPRAEIRYLAKDEAEAKFGPLAEGLLADQRISNERIKRLLQWKPYHTPFVHDIRRYYEAWKIGSLQKIPSLVS